jgi:hypothetical protein
VRILCIDHGVIDCPETADRLAAVSRTASGLLNRGRAMKVYRKVGWDTTRYVVVAQEADEDGIIDGLADVVRAQDPSWTVTVNDGEGHPIH